MDAFRAAHGPLSTQTIWIQTGREVVLRRAAQPSAIKRIPHFQRRPLLTHYAPYHGNYIRSCTSDDFLVLAQNIALLQPFKAILDDIYKLKDFGAPMANLGSTIHLQGLGAIHAMQLTLISKAIECTDLRAARIHTFPSPNSRSRRHEFPSPSKTDKLIFQLLMGDAYDLGDCSRPSIVFFTSRFARYLTLHTQQQHIFLKPALHYSKHTQIQAFLFWPSSYPTGINT